MFAASDSRWPAKSRETLVSHKISKKQQSMMDLGLMAHSLLLKSTLLTPIISTRTSPSSRSSQHPLARQIKHILYLSLSIALLGHSKPHHATVSHQPAAACKRATPQGVAHSLFEAARLELGIPSRKLSSRQWNGFFRFLPSQCLIAGIQGKCLAFVPIYKAGNDAIRAFLIESVHAIHLAENAENGGYFTLDHSSCYARSHKPVVKRARMPDLRGLCYDSVFSLTFTREPLTHFIAGYGEFIWRVYANSLSGLSLSTEQISAARRRMAKDRNNPSALLRKLIAGDVSWATNDALHMALMSGSLENGFGSFDFVGRLPNMATDLEHALLASGLVNERTKRHVHLRHDVGMHASSLDQLGSRSEMRDLLATNHSLRRALCHILSPDYHCFGYDISACINGTALFVHS